MAIMNLVEHNLFPELVKLTLYNRNIEEFGGQIEDSKVIKYGRYGCLLTDNTIDSENILWWRCEKYSNYTYHHHKMSIKDKVATFGQGCDKCRRLIEIPGMFSSVSEVQACWDWERNTTTPDKIKAQAHAKYHFICELGHEYRKSCAKFFLGRRCAYCSGQEPLDGFNTFNMVTDAIEWWDYEENDKIGLKINNITRGSDKTVNFICPEGHKYKTKCHKFTSGQRCDVCYRSRLPKPEEAFANVKDVKEWWDYEENARLGLDINTLFRTTKTEVYFRCPLGHSFDLSCCEFTSGVRCGVCNGKRPLDGYNTFNTVPDATKWWDYEENDKLGLKIDMISKSSHKRAHFKCPNGHRYTTRCSKFYEGKRCKICCIYGCSKIAVEYIECISKKYNVFIQHGKNIGEFTIPSTRYRADGYFELNGVKIVIEFHGELFHGFRGLKRQYEFSPFNKKKTFGEIYNDTIRKENTIRELGYKLIVIWEDDYRNLRDDYLNGKFVIPEIEEALKC